MNVYVINILLTIFWGGLFLHEQKNKKAFIIVVSIQMILLSGLRDTSIGADTWNYENHFYELINPELAAYYSWGALFHKIFEIGEFTARDIGCELFTKLFATVIPSFRVYLFFVALVVCVGTGRFLYRYSEDICLSYVIFESFLLDFFLLTGIRQALAVCIAVLWGYDLIRQKKLIKYIIVCLIAAWFHASAVIMIPVYFIFNRKREIRGKFAIIISLSVVFILFGQKLNKLISLGLYAIYAETSGITAYTFIMLMLALVIATALLHRYGILPLKSRYDRDIVDGTLLSVLFISTSALYSILFRIGYYFFYFMICLFPILLRSFDARSKRIVKIMLYVVFIVYTYQKGIEYRLCF